MADPGWVRVATLRSPEAFRRHLEAGGIPLSFDDALATPSDSPFARALEADGLRAGNRFCILPMEGWDGTADGHPTELTRRRWRNFGLSGAKLIWGGEAAAVRHDGRANPCQLVIGAATWESLARLRDDLVAATSRASEARLGRRGGGGAPRRPREPLPARDRRRDLGVARPPARRPRRGPRGELRKGRRERPRGGPADHPLGPLRAPERLGSTGAARRLRPPGPRPALPRRRADPDRRGPRPPGRRLRAGRGARAAGRVPVRGREALPRLPRPRAPGRARPARPLRRQPREPDPLPAHGRRGHPRRGPGPAHRGALLRLRHGALAEGPGRTRRARAGRRGLHVGLRPPPRRAHGGRPRREPRAPPHPARPRHPLGLRQRRAAPTTTRTCSGPRSSPRATATCRPRTRSSASPARSAPRRS